MSFSLTGVDDEATQRCFAHIHDRVRATLVRGEPVTVAAGRPVRRTLKLLRALARGHWIVGEEYVAACARNRGVAVDPAPFEEGMLPHVPGAQLSRLSGGGRALAGLTVTLRGATVMPHADLCSLCCEAGARVQYGRPISDAGAVEVYALSLPPPLHLSPSPTLFSTPSASASAPLLPPPPPPKPATPVSGPSSEASLGAFPQVHRNQPRARLAEAVVSRHLSPPPARDTSTTRPRHPT